MYLAKRMIKNAAECRECGDVIESTHVHDFKFCSCKAIFVDGGLVYIRWAGDPINRCEYETITLGPNFTDCLPFDFNVGDLEEIWEKRGYFIEVKDVE